MEIKSFVAAFVGAFVADEVGEEEEGDNKHCKKGE